MSNRLIGPAPAQIVQHDSAAARHMQHIVLAQHHITRHRLGSGRNRQFEIDRTGGKAAEPNNPVGRVFFRRQRLPPGKPAQPIRHRSGQTGHQSGESFILGQTGRALLASQMKIATAGIKGEPFGHPRTLGIRRKAEVSRAADQPEWQAVYIHGAASRTISTAPARRGRQYRRCRCQSQLAAKWKKRWSPG